MRERTYRIRRLLLAAALLVFLVPAGAQTTRVDSLKKRLSQAMPDTTRLATLRKLSAAYTSVDPLKKLSVARQFMALARKLHNEEAIADGLSDIGVSCSIQGKNDSALYYYQEAYKQAKKVNYLVGMGKSLTNAGYTLDRMDNYTESIKYYFQALAIFDRIRYDKGINQCNTNIGSIYFDLGQYKLALSYFNLVLDNYTKSQDQQGLGYAMFTVGNCYSELGQYDKALGFFNKSLAIREKLGDKSGIALVHRSLGILYKKQGRYDEALKHLRIALPIVKSYNDRYLEGAITMVMAEAFEGKNDHRTAEEYALTSLRLGRAVDSKLLCSEALTLLAEANKNMHNLAKALEYQTAYTEVKDSIFNEKILKDVTVMELGRMRSQNSELARDNRAIHSRNTDNQGKIENYGRTILIIGLSLLIVVIFAAVLFIRNKEKMLVNKVLFEQKEEIAAMNEELESANEEITTQNEIVLAQNKELERLNSIKNKFFSIISHDLRSPLNTLRSLFVFYRRGDLDTRELGEFLAQLEGSIVETATFLDNLLEWSRGQMAGITAHPVDFDIATHISDTIRLHDAQAGLKKIDIRSDVNGPLMVHADPNMIDLVLRNLLSNSIKFCDTGDEIVFSSRTESGRAIICVRDTGQGIREDDREKIFSLEHTLSTGTQGEKGNGLGLILCRDMLALNNGLIWFDTEPGKGTTFSFEINLAAQP